MSSLTQFKSRGRAYQCKRCNKIDRKGRLVGHVLKHHVPFDQVPFLCSLCSFRCQERQALTDHIKNCSRHREMEAKLGAPDYTKVLKMSANPYYIGDNDITQLSREESLRWFSRNYQSENMLDESDGIFEDDEDEVVTSDGLALPRWLFGVSLTSPKATQPFAVTTTSVVKAPVFTVSTLSGGHPQIAPQTSSFQNQPFSFQPVIRPTQQPPVGTFGPVVPSAFLSMHNSFSTIDQSDLDSIVGRQPVLAPAAPRSNLNTPVLHMPSPTQYPPTPCLDEHGSINILPGLMNFDRNDPLFVETQQMTVPLSQPNETLMKKARLCDPSVCSSGPVTVHCAPVSVQPSSSKTTTSSSSHGVPVSSPSSTVKTIVPVSSHGAPVSTPSSTSQASSSVPTSGAETSSTSSNNTNTQEVILSVITDAAKLIAGAIDSNTCAIRCQERTLEKVVDELTRIERKINQIEKTQAEKLEPKPASSAALKENKLNSKQMKSVVNVVKPK